MVRVCFFFITFHCFFFFVLFYHDIKYFLAIRKLGQTTVIYLRVCRNKQ